MSDKFDYEAIAAEVLEEFDQSDSFQQRFVGFCDNAMKGKAEDNDLRKLINKTELPEGEEYES